MREHVQLLLGIRKIRHWTQEDLARELSVSARTVRRWENGEAEPNARDMQLFRDMLAQAPDPPVSGWQWSPRNASSKPDRMVNG